MAKDPDNPARLTPERIAELDARTRELAAQLAHLQAQIKHALEPPGLPHKPKPKDHRHNK